MGTVGRRWVRWNKKNRAAFLDHLAGSCNVKQAAAAAGVSPESVYALRRKDERFAEEWHGALMAGYDLLETEVVGFALAGGNAARTIETGAAAIDVDVAMRALSVHRSMLQGARTGGPRLKQATREETDAAILRKLDALAKRRAAEGGGDG